MKTFLFCFFLQYFTISTIQVYFIFRFTKTLTFCTNHFNFFLYLFSLNLMNYLITKVFHFMKSFLNFIHDHLEPSLLENEFEVYLLFINFSSDLLLFLNVIELNELSFSLVLEKKYAN